jgi:hypothetical protein
MVPRLRTVHRYQEGRTMRANTSTSAPPSPPTVTWASLAVGNPSLRSWQRSATAAGFRALTWWLPGASQSVVLLRDVGVGVGPDTPPEVYGEALRLVWRRLEEAYNAARAQVERQARQQQRQGRRSEHRRD